MWREVSRPVLLRPPVFFFGSSRLFAGFVFRDFVESRERLETQRRSEWAKIFECHKTLDEIDLLAFLQRHDRFLPMRFAAEVGAALAFLFAGVIAGVHVHDLLLKELLDRLLDLNLVRARTDAENILVLLLAQERRLFRQRRGLDDIVGLVHSAVRPFRQLSRNAFVRHENLVESEQLLRVHVARPSPAAPASRCAPTCRCSHRTNPR